VFRLTHSRSAEILSDNKTTDGACVTRYICKNISIAIRAGSVWVNCYQAMDPAVPFGGYKMSGYGRESGLQHVEEYLNVKAVWIKTA
jgi:aldehyde dehydrogenase (NAD+)